MAFRSRAVSLSRRRANQSPQKRRESWEWPCPDKHPEIGIQWIEERQAYRAAVHSAEKLTAKYFPLTRYTSRAAALAAAKVWRKRTKDPKAHSNGRKLDIERAGGVFSIYRSGRLHSYGVSLNHDSIRLSTAYGAVGDPAAALAKAELMLECYREEMRHYTRLTAAKQRALRWA